MAKKVIVVTDGDEIAQGAVETAAGKLGLRTISRSGGNPTPLSGAAIAELVLEAQGEIAIVMCDDRGISEQGKGEEAILEIAQDPRLKIIGAVAVASNTPSEGVRVQGSITSQGDFVEAPVDKEGKVKKEQHLFGDTVDILATLGIGPVVGLGDPGKMDYQDEIENGAPLTTKAITEILRLSGEKLPLEGRNWESTGELEVGGREL